MAELLAITTSRMIDTGRLRTRELSCGAANGLPVIFVHGNFAAATWWEETMLRLPSSVRAIAYDQRSFAHADPAAKVNAQNGLGDFADDLVSLMDLLNIDQAHLVGHSLGGAVLWNFLAKHPERALSVTLVAPCSPYGFGGCTASGQSCFPDNSGSGAAAVSPAFVEQMRNKSKNGTGPTAPATVMKYIVCSPQSSINRLDDLLEASLAQHLGEQDYPGDSVASPNWPYRAPGKYGPANALAPIYQQDPLAFVRIEPKPRILWLRGVDDAVISDMSLLDPGYIGQLGMVPGWPGKDFYPAQPMISQIRFALEEYQARGGSFKEQVLACGHSPFLELPAEFDATFHDHLEL